MSPAYVGPYVCMFAISSTMLMSFKLNWRCSFVCISVGVKTNEIFVLNHVGYNTADDNIFSNA